MDLKQYLLDTFHFNDITNRQLLDKIALLAEQDEALALFSHMINSHNKWMAAIELDPGAPAMSWWHPVYPFQALNEEWSASIQRWTSLIKQKSLEELDADVSFIRYDGARWLVPLKDIALQLNYHSIHHRAQIQTIIRKAGMEPDFVDYIRLKYRRAEA